MKIKRVVSLAILVALGACSKIQETFVEYKVRHLQSDPSLADPRRIDVILCGTGTPQQTDRARAQACTLISAGGQLFLFDAGEGATSSLESSRVPMASISRVFITHLHSDHFNGLGDIINQSWIEGRHQLINVYGPPGIEKVVSGLSTAYGPDIEFRMRQVGSSPDLARAQATVVKLPESSNVVRVYSGSGVTVDAYRVLHEPVEPSYGYVLTYKGKKIFVSGDTRVDPIYLPAMQGSDLVVHEALQVELVNNAADAMQHVGMADRARITREVIKYHADTLKLAEMAQAAGVKHLVMTHLIPAPDNFLTSKLFIKGMKDRYQGKITIGEDGMRFTIQVS